MTTLPDFQVPKISGEDDEENKGTFTIEPLDKGFGYTFGNSLRRVLLSSLGGAAITSVRIEGVAHEFSTIPGLKEDVTDLVLNLKDVVVRMHTDADEVETPLVATGPGEVKAKDIDLPAGVEILNPEAPIATLEKKTKLEMYLTIGRGRGYSPADENKSEDQPIGVIPIDSIFSPIRRASYSVDSARVGQRTDFDKLTLEVETDGSIEPGAALREAAEILIKSLAIFTDRRPRRRAARRGRASGHRRRRRGAEAAAVPGADGLDEILIEELELGVRSYNCLKRAGIQTVGELVRKSESRAERDPELRSQVDRGGPGDPARPRPLAAGRLGRLESPRTGTGDEAPAQESTSSAATRRTARSLLRTMSKQLIEHERIRTTQPKAKALKPEFEKLITLAKRGDLHARRQALSELGQDKFAVHKLFEEIAPRYCAAPRRLHADRQARPAAVGLGRDGLPRAGLGLAASLQDALPVGAGLDRHQTLPEPGARRSRNAAQISVRVWVAVSSEIRDSPPKASRR